MKARAAFGVGALDGQRVRGMLAALVMSALLPACQAQAPEPRGATSEPTATPAASQTSSAQRPSAAPLVATSAPSERRFGGQVTLPGEPLPVAQLLAQPEPYLGKRVKCEGKVARVCKNAGCWLELQAEQGGDGLRVPMAGHAFFIPQEAVGLHAVVEGELNRQPLDANRRAHYESEGMQAVGPLSLEATAVVLR